MNKKQQQRMKWKKFKNRKTITNINKSHYLFHWIRTVKWVFFLFFAALLYIPFFIFILWVKTEGKKCLPNEWKELWEHFFALNFFCISDWSGYVDTTCIFFFFYFSYFAFYLWFFYNDIFLGSITLTMSFKCSYVKWKLFNVIKWWWIYLDIRIHRQCE